MNPDQKLDALLRAARDAAPDTASAEFAFETRLLARLREERGGAWFAIALKLSPLFAALVVAAAAWCHSSASVEPDPTYALGRRAQRRRQCAGRLAAGGRPMKRFRGCLMVAFIFFCGFLVGGFLGLAFGWMGFFHKIVKGGPGAIREVVMERAAHDLKLKPEQKLRVKAIIDETGAELTTATAEIRPKIEEIMGRNEERIREVLDPKQRKKFDQFVSEGRRRWKTAVEERTPSIPPATEVERPTPVSPPQ